MTKKHLQKNKKSDIMCAVLKVHLQYRGLVKWYDRGLQNLWWEFDSLIPCSTKEQPSIKYMVHWSSG